MIKELIQNRSYAVKVNAYFDNILNECRGAKVTINENPEKLEITAEHRNYDVKYVINKNEFQNSFLQNIKEKINGTKRSNRQESV